MIPLNSVYDTRDASFHTLRCSSIAHAQLYTKLLLMGRKNIQAVTMLARVHVQPAPCNLLIPCYPNTVSFHNEHIRHHGRYHLPRSLHPCHSPQRSTKLPFPRPHPTPIILLRLHSRAGSTLSSLNNLLSLEHPTPRIQRLDPFLRTQHPLRRPQHLQKPYPYHRSCITQGRLQPPGNTNRRFDPAGGERQR